MRPIRARRDRPDFWRGRRVLLTGHTGFRGAWLSLWLKRMAEAHGFALAPDPVPLFETAGVGDDIVSTIGDLRDANAVKGGDAGRAPAIVMHLAARAHRSRRDRRSDPTRSART